jgi:hypothetical protein
LASILQRAAERRRRREDGPVLPPDRTPVADLCKPLSANVQARSAMLNFRGDFVGENPAILRQRREKDGHGIPDSERRHTPLRNLTKKEPRP